MDYHLFKKATKSKNKIIHRWYYYFIDPVSGKKIFLLLPRFISVPPIAAPRSVESGCLPGFYSRFAHSTASVKTRALSHMLWRGKPSPRSVLAAILATRCCGLVRSPLLLFYNVYIPSVYPAVERVLTFNFVPIRFHFPYFLLFITPIYNF